ncbi:ABC transporter permease [Dactylosporangium sp. NBC_01737]|uniref:ABC transporter permease n=1 Tax=Dactylosporangium sp. NBC_01737 TaxID=2975959 RepID=UPI002E0D1F26|nr:ABC transporter permease [Dactylosporangium sp. NBC_01737]
MNWLRILVVGGVTSYRALFGWLSPWILIPSLVVAPLAQIMLFAYIGRSAGLETDTFFVVGNAVQYAAIPCLFGMTSTIAGERLQGTLGIVLVSPASRLALVLGRALPVLVNGFGVALFGLFAGGALLGVAVPYAAIGPVVLAVLTCSGSCIGLGLVNAAFGLRLLDTAVLSNLLFGVLLLFSGANIPPGALPSWMAAIGEWMPLTHGIAATRALVAGATLAGVGHLLITEALIGAGYGLAGALLLRLLEIESRRSASLEAA